jgi:hypothetical protein
LTMQILHSTADLYHSVVRQHVEEFYRRNSMQMGTCDF